jgi:hypothetical protein
MNKMITRSGKAILIACISLLGLQSVFAQEGGYVSALSVAKGETLSFFLSTSVQTFDLEIYKLGNDLKFPIMTLHSLKGFVQAVPDSSYTKGCGWSKSGEIIIPTDWLPGVYEADFPTSSGMKPLVFVVRDMKPGSYSKVVVNLTVNTWEAYNNWGGKSLYNYNSNERKSAVKVSFNRPFSDSTTALYYRWTDKLVKWLEKEKIKVEFCVNTDFDRDSSFAKHYNVYLTVGHDEYWSYAERNQCEQLLSRGGKMVVLSGNTCWWQVRLEDNLRTLVCFRDPSLDPYYYLGFDSLVTSVWSRSPINNPPNSFLGVSFEAGGYVNNDTILPVSKGYGGYTVYNANHWIYEDADVADGDVIGMKDSIVGYETDGAYFNWIDGIPVSVNISNTPANLTFLGISPAAGSDNTLRGHATMGYFTFPSGGAVFNSASINWVNGLGGTESVIPQMLRNVLRQFTSKVQLPPEIVLAEPVTFSVENINNESVDVPSRTFQYTYNDSQIFFVHAVDPQGKDLRYFWKIGEKIVSRDTLCILKTDILDMYPAGISLEAFVSNGDDTVSVEWKLVNADMAIVSIPPTDSFPLHSGYLYNSKAISKRSPRISYSLIGAPSWLHISHKGMIYGSLDTTPGVYSVILRAEDDYHYFDTQKFTIVIIDTSKIADVSSRNDNLSKENSGIECYPNPFDEKINLTLTLACDGEVELIIYDVTGSEIRALLPASELQSGSHNFVWDRMTNDSRKVPEGIYLCRVIIKTSSGKNLNIIKKLVVI